MNPHIEASRSGADTCSYNGKRLHSGYDPLKEAARFADELAADERTEWILVTGPALSYCAAFLRKRFPRAKLAAVRYSTFFSFCDTKWDAVLDGTLQNRFLDEDIYSLMGEEGIARCAFASWKPSEAAFPAEYAHAWQKIKSAVEKGRSVYATREYFAPVWARNAVRFCTSVQHTALAEHGDAPVVIAASGPSLAPLLPFLKERRGAFFLIAVSSALLPLEHAGIVPDLCMSCDGGWWAQKHLERTRLDIPFAFPAEAAVPAAFFPRRTIVPLRYGDALESVLLDSCGIPSMAARRNGTVSGTAAEFALALTSGTVYCCGLDLEAGAGRGHTQPNALETLGAAGDYALRPLQTRLAPGSFGGGSMDIYRAWFSSRASQFNGRLRRLCAAPYRSRLGAIPDMSPADFVQCEAENAHSLPRIRAANITQDERTRRRTAAALFADTGRRGSILAELFPVEALHPQTLEAAGAEKFRQFMERIRRYTEA